MQVTQHILRIVSFSAADGQGVEMPHDDALVVKAIIHNFWVQKNLMDNGKKVNLPPYHVFQAMKILEENLVRDQTPIKGIGVVLMQVEGKVKLLLTLKPPLIAQTPYAQLLVVKLPLIYNAILGHLVL